MSDIVDRLKSLEAHLDDWREVDDVDRETVKQARAEIERLRAKVAKADALAKALKPFAATLERYSGYTEYALFGVWEDVRGAAGRKLNILRKENFDDAKTALAAYRETDT